MILEIRLPEIEGVTQKQIDHATKLRKGLVTKLQNAAHGEPIYYNGRKIQANIKVLEIMLKELNEIKDAGHWIDNQDFYEYYKLIADELNKKEKFVKAMMKNKEKTTAAKAADVYIAGSHDDKKKIGGYGIVIISEDNIEEINEFITEIDILEGYNISVKMAAAIRALNLCIELHITEINFHHDLKIFETLIRPESTPKTKMTKKYKEAYLNAKQYAKINFIMTGSLDGNKYFENARELARMAINKLEKLP